MESLFDTFLGLPLHPLVVHAAVVLLPLSALSLVAAFLVPAWRRRAAGPTVIGVVVAAASTLIAKESGEALARHQGVPFEHAEWADRLVPVAGILMLVALLWYAAQRTDHGTVALVSGVVMTILALAATVLVGLVGHSGAQAVWGDTAAASSGGSGSSATPTSGSTSTPTGTASPTAAASATSYTLAQVATHKTASSCWTTIDRKVYDLTSWINDHPGGPAPIEGLCGTDGSAAFTAQHGSDAKPHQRLAGFQIGVLAG